MPFISKIEARAYARATEIVERIETAVSNIFPKKIRPKISMQTTTAEGQSGNSILIVSGLIEGRENCDAILDFILGEMRLESQRALRRSIDLRLDDNCVFFLRIDKQAAYLGELKLTDNADVISIRFHFRNYPRSRREEVIQMIEDRLQVAGER